MNRYFIFVLICVATVASAAHSSSVCKKCKVTGFQPDPRRNGTYLYFEQGDWSESVNPCGCTMAIKAFFVPHGSKMEQSILSSALAAMLADKQVEYVYGTGDCSNSNYETISHFLIKSA